MTYSLHIWHLPAGSQGGYFLPRITAGLHQHSSGPSESFDTQITLFEAPDVWTGLLWLHSHPSSALLVTRAALRRLPLSTAWDPASFAQFAIGRSNPFAWCLPSMARPGALRGSVPQRVHALVGGHALVKWTGRDVWGRERVSEKWVLWVIVFMSRPCLLVYTTLHHMGEDHEFPRNGTSYIWFCPGARDISWCSRSFSGLELDWVRFCPQKTSIS